MLLISAVFIIVLGLLIGIALFYTSPIINHSKNKLINYVHIGVSSINNALRSIPFIVLLVIMIPFTVLIVGTMLGVAGAIPPLIISATPFFAQIVYNSLIEVDRGTIEACRAMGASPFKMLLVIIRECLSPLIRGVAMTLITLVGFISVAGVVGAGGLGQFAVNAQYKHATLFV
jgi:D-methionine transport system permease protein